MPRLCAASASNTNAPNPTHPRPTEKPSFVQTSLREWAEGARGSVQQSWMEWRLEGYAKAYDTSEQRRRDLATFLFRYNWLRPHQGINAKTPISRLGLTVDNLLRLHS